MKKIRVAVIFGGKTAEHEVSLQSAKNIVGVLDKDKYDTVLIGIDKKGRWHLNENSRLLLGNENPKLKALNDTSHEVALVAGRDSGQLVNISKNTNLGAIDVVFPILHGPFGEDGTIQGLLKLSHLPFVGSGVLASAVGMDKDVMKRLLKEAGLPVAKFSVIQDFDSISYAQAARTLGNVLFVKPANLGSSVGVTKVKNRAEFEQAIQQAFKFDRKIIIEEYIKGREVECAVLGNDKPKSSVVGEIISAHEFYSYEAKYMDENGAKLEIPAKIPVELSKKIQGLAIRAFKALCCEGMARVDFFISNNKKPVVNEVNTIPGFTKISMYPKLWEASGIPYPQLIDELINLALERHAKEQRLQTTLL